MMAMDPVGSILLSTSFGNVAATCLALFSGCASLFSFLFIYFYCPQFKPNMISPSLAFHPVHQTSTLKSLLLAQMSFWSAI